LEGKDIECVFSSDLWRARQTARIIAEATDAPVHLDPRLRERGFGQLEGEPTRALSATLTGIVDDSVTDTRCRPPGGESLDELYSRCRDFLDWLRVRGQQRDVVVVAHGGSVRMLRAAGAGLGPADLAWGPVDNASVHRLVLAVSPLPTGEGADPAPAPFASSAQSPLTVGRA
jgi:probable phosphoglycerate mutase